MVEFAIILPLLIVLLFGIIEFGRAFNANISLTHAAREGVREYAITQDAAAGTAAALGAATSLDSGAMVVAVSACNLGDPTTLRINYPFQLSIPFFPSSAVQLRAEGVMRCGG
jgi:Flp pilus assembly protein TadG